MKGIAQNIQQILEVEQNTAKIAEITAMIGKLEVKRSISTTDSQSMLWFQSNALELQQDCESVVEREQTITVFNSE